MRNTVFGNEFFDQWLDQKSSEILSKVEKEKISTEDMLILSLKAQVNHFHHMDIEFREEFKSIKQQFEQIIGQTDVRFEQVDKRFEQIIGQADVRFEQVDKRFEQIIGQTNSRFEHADKRFEQIDKRFDRQATIMMWGFGLVITTNLGVFLKLIFQA